MSFLSLIYSALAFIAAIGILVTIHEFGHYWVARLSGVKVLRFSVGFGKPLLIKRSGPDNTEYALSAIPLGGYVKMLDEREGEVAEHELPRAFNRQPVSKRFAIVFAGPAFNFLFAIIAYSLMYMNGVGGLKPVVGEIQVDSLADHAGLQLRDQILSVNGQATPSWERARLTLLQESVDQSTLKLQVRGDNLIEREVMIDIATVNFLDDDQTDILKQLGFESWRPQLPPVIDEVLADGAAEEAGVMAGDRIVSLDGQTITNINQWIDLIRANPDQPLELVVERESSRVILQITPRLNEQDGETFGYIGVKNVIVVPEEIRREMLVVEQYGFVDATIEGISKTWQMSVLTLKVLGKLVIGEASLKNLSGPITIAKYAGLSAQIGMEQFFAFLAIISISLGVLNLLPIPMLDGGHLLYYLVEIVKGSPVSENIEMMGQRVGLAVLMMLMSIAIYNDILRLVE